MIRLLSYQARYQGMSVALFPPQITQKNPLFMGKMKVKVTLSVDLLF